MIRKNNGLIAALAVAAALLCSTSAQASHPDKHDSNTLHKIGNAIQYPVRKDTENLSVDIHRGEHRKSVESMRPQKATAVVIPNGKKFVVAHRGIDRSMYAHRNYGQYRRTQTYGYHRSSQVQYYHRHHRRHHHHHHRHHMK